MHAVLLYNCPDLTDACSSCLGLNVTNEFECGWCDRPTGVTGTCSVAEDCPEQSFITSRLLCPTPIIADFNPKFGPPEGGTTITITGRDLGATFDDFTAPGTSIAVGDIPCTPTDPENYIPGQSIRCTIIESGGFMGPVTINITLSNGAAISEIPFNIVSPQIARVFPSRGPQAGGTRITVYGSDLNIGNTEETRVTVVGGTECIVE
jgi:plexin A